MASDLARYVVVVGPGIVEQRETLIPLVADDEVLLRVESCGVCGSDVGLVRNHDPQQPPIAPGHEPVGRIERIGPVAARQWGLGDGDRVAVNARRACHRCIACRHGKYCTDMAGPTGIAGHGFLEAEDPALNGGFATHLLLSSLIEVVPVPETVSVGAASVFNALANGYAWAVQAGGVGPGQRVAILGPGPRGIACAIASHAAGASEICITGLAADRNRLEFAASVCGAVPVELEEASDPIEIGRDLGAFDLVVDTTPGSTTATGMALTLAGQGATVVLGGLKHGRAASLDVDAAIMKELTLKGARSSGTVATRMAIEALTRNEYDFDAWASHRFPLDQFLDAIDAAAGSGVDPRPLHVRVEPFLDTSHAA